MFGSKYNPYRWDAFDFHYLRGSSHFRYIRRYYKNLAHRMFRRASRQELREWDGSQDVGAMLRVSVGYIL